MSRFLTAGVLQQGALLSLSPPEEVPDWAVITSTGAYVKTPSGAYVTVPPPELIPPGAIMTLGGDYVKTLNNEFITI